VGMYLLGSERERERVKRAAGIKGHGEDINARGVVDC